MDLKLRPSSAWALCSALPYYERDSPLFDIPSESRDEGIACAWVADQLIKSRGLVPVPVGSLSANGIVITQGMYDDVINPYLEALNYAHCDQDVMTVQAEKSIPMPHFPTAPIAIMDSAWISSKAIVTIRDLKAGGIFVDSYGNYQLMQYAEAIYADADQLCKKAGHPGVMGWDLGIIQPRLNNYASWRFTNSEWDNVHRVNLWERARRVDTPEETPGSHCKNCKGRHKCKTIRQLALWGAEKSGEMNPVDLDLNGVEHEYEMLSESLESMKARISGLKADIMGRIKQGEPSTYTPRTGEGKYTFDIPAKSVIELGDSMNIDVRGAVKTKTPLQCVTAGIPANVIDMVASRKGGKLELKKQDANLAKKTFDL